MIQVSASKSTLRIVLLVSVIGLTASIILAAFQLWKTKDYVPVSAMLTRIDKEIDYGIRDGSRSGVTRYYHYSYSVNNTEYEHVTRSFFGIFRRVDRTYNLYVDRTSPSIVRNSFALESIVIAMILFSAFLGFSVKVLRTSMANDRFQN